TFEMEWDQRDAAGAPVSPGQYTAQASLTAREALLTEPLPFRIGAAGDSRPPHAVTARPAEQSGIRVGEVLVNGQVVLRIREEGGGLSAVRRAEIIAGRLDRYLREGLRSDELRVGTTAGEAGVLWRGRLVVTADARHARLNRTTPLALARLWRGLLARALSP
ncbi:MAG TPA: hypothetical protein VFJ45_01875, partial [bacterium]|nr:hypothetical protein [bacterium]